MTNDKKLIKLFVSAFAMEVIMNKTIDVELRNTGLERSERLAKDLEWIKDQGHVLPEPSDLGVNYANYLKELSIVKDSHLILCHFYNLYFGHTAGGRIMAKRYAINALSEKIMNNKELEFYKWDGEVSQLLQNVTDKLNKLTESWTREEKNQCLGETEISFKYYGDIISLILS
ncbi:heme oxygenase 1, chloroplastic [Morus notabilis]|uniref:heme oxygenase 1, chloroplastic n=1 Tax=Morus notabilis TaxID=981085 RepID=UPI000CECE42E|nr:heme oxygenase 1, chloroplastic [Morus notabilis]